VTGLAIIQKLMTLKRLASKSMNQPYRTIPLTPLRNIIAARMTEAKQGIPHYRVSMDIEVDALLALRQQINADNTNSKLSVNDFIIKACANALMEHPALNCQFIGNEIHQYEHADISVVIAVEGGLSTPVVRCVDQKNLEEIAEEVKTLAKRASAGQLKMREITGGTFSISNLGMYGVDQFDAIINPPQCAILAVGAAKLQPVIKGDTVTKAQVMRVSLSLDHRVIDGATGAQFLSTFVGLLQNPAQLLSE